jgi:hypothetical protein
VVKGACAKAWLWSHGDVRLAPGFSCAGRVFHEGPVDRIRGVPVRARKNYCSSADSKNVDPVRISAQRKGVCVKWYQSIEKFLCFL